MKALAQRLAADQLGAYGFTLNASDNICRAGLDLRVKISASNGRFYAHTPTGVKLWSGRDLGDFAARFWCAKKVIGDGIG